MELGEALERLREAVGAGKLVILVGEMEVYYEGRSMSWLGRGERMLIIKSDRSVLVHRPRGYEPVNWQPPGSHVEAWAEEDRLVVACGRTTPPERLKIVVHRVIGLYAYRLLDEAEFKLHAREEDMKLAIMEEPSIIEEGFRVVESERRVRDGAIDILGVDSQGRLVVVEIKRGRASKDDVMQLARYTEQIEGELGTRPRSILVAPSISPSASSLSARLRIEFRRFSPRRAHEILRRARGLDRFLGSSG